LFLPDSGGSGQQGTLRAALKVSRPETTVIGGLMDTGTVAIDNVRLIEGTGGVWRREFENGIVLVNPTPEPLYVSQADVAGPRKRTAIKRIRGTQVPGWNDGSAVTEGLWLGPADGIVLLAERRPAPVPSTPGKTTVFADADTATLVWEPVAEYSAGYILRYGERSEHLTHGAAAGPTAWVRLVDLTPGTTYNVQIAAHDFLGRQGAPLDMTFTTAGVSPDRPSFALAPPGSLAPGSVAILEGRGLASEDASASGPILPLTLAGTTVRVNGIDAALLSVAPGRISFITPWQITGPDAVVAVTRDGITGPERRAPIVASHPRLLTWPGSDVSVATHADGTLLSAESGAGGGEWVDLLAFGLGAVIDFPSNGTPAAAEQRARVAASIDVRIAGQTADVLGGWLTPFDPATYKIRVHIPQDVPPGLQPVEVSVGGETANVVRIPAR
jgi:uncharacterized protein (TIGR03437 family)